MKKLKCFGNCINSFCKRWCKYTSAKSISLMHIWYFGRVEWTLCFVGWWDFSTKSSHFIPHHAFSSEKLPWPFLGTTFVLLKTFLVYFWTQITIFWKHKNIPRSLHEHRLFFFLSCWLPVFPFLASFNLHLRQSNQQGPVTLATMIG